MLDAHLFVGHRGTKKTFEYLAKQYVWENMYVDVHDCVKCCIECTKDWPLEPKTKYRSILPDFAFHTISIDVVGPFTESISGCKFLIVAIDKLTKWVEAVWLHPQWLESQLSLFYILLFLGMDVHRRSLQTTEQTSQLESHRS